MDSEMEIYHTWQVRETSHFQKLTIHEGASVEAPEGKFAVLTVNGVGHPIRPGTYCGDVTVSVADYFHMPPHGLMKMMQRSEDFCSALVIEDNKIAKEKCVPALLCGGTVTAHKTEGIEIQSDEEAFNGILVTGDSRYQIRDARIFLEGFSRNDFMGVGAGITAINNAHVKIDNCDLTLSGVTRCAIHCGGDSIIEVNDSRILNLSPDDPEWMGEFSWGIGVTGSNRLVQLADNGTVYYNNCYLKTNGWGVFSIDGCDDSAKIFVKDCTVDLSGPRAHGYGAFCIGDRNVVSFDHSNIHVNGYALMVRGMIDGAAKAEIINGCTVTGNRFAVLCVGDYHTPVTLADSDFRTGRSVLAVKGSSTHFSIRNCKMEAGNHVILQLMDNDEAGMDVDAVRLPDRADAPVPGRDLTRVTPGQDVIVDLADLEVEGDFYNSTTNLHMEKECKKGGVGTHSTFGGMFTPPEDAAGSFPGASFPEGTDAPPPMEHDRELRGPKNMNINLKNSRVEGRISSATQRYMPGLEWIDEKNRLELTNITQEAAPPVNNGVIVTVDTDSTWIVTDTCYLTSLTLGDHAIVKARCGRELHMSIDGIQTRLEPGKSYAGNIMLSPV